MQKLTIDLFEIRESEDGRIAICIPSVNSFEYIEKTQTVELAVNGNIVNINYYQDGAIHRQIIIKDLKIRTLIMLLKSDAVVVLEIVEDKSFTYPVTEIKKENIALN